MFEIKRIKHIFEATLAIGLRQVVCITHLKGYLIPQTTPDLENISDFIQKRNNMT